MNDTDPDTLPSDGSAAPAVKPRETGAATAAAGAATAAAGAGPLTVPGPPAATTAGPATLAAVGRVRPISPRAAAATTHDNGDSTGDGEVPPPSTAMTPDSPVLAGAAAGVAVITGTSAGNAGTARMATTGDDPTEATPPDTTEADAG